MAHDRRKTLVCYVRVSEDTEDWTLAFYLGNTPGFRKRVRVRLDDGTRRTIDVPVHRLKAVEAWRRPE